MINLEQFYACVEGDADEVVSRLGGSESMVRRFLKKFLDDESFALLSNSLDSGDTQAAFRGAHSLKGVAASLGLNKLFTCSYKITELLRSGKLEEGKAAFPELKKIYNETCDLIKELD